MRFRYHAIAVLSGLLVTVTPAIAQPKPSPVLQTSPSLNPQQQQELQQLREEKRLHELIKKDLEDSKMIGDRVQAEVDRAFGRMMNWLNALLVVLTLFPILTVLGFWLLRRSVLSELLAEITKSGEEIKRETVGQISAAKQEIEQVTSETKTQLEGMVLEAKQVLTALREQTAAAQTELDSLKTEAKSQIYEAVSATQQEKDRIFEQLSKLLPASIQEPVAAENLPKVQAITTELETLQSANPTLTLTANDYLNQGKALFYEGRYDEALVAFSNAIKLKPDDPNAWNNRGVALGNLKRYTEALEAYEKAIELKPDNLNAWYNRGGALKDSQQYIDAIAAYNKALELQPDDHEILYRKACCYGLQGKTELAVEQLQEAIKLNADYREKAKTESDFDAIRKDERFKQLIER